VSNNVDRINVNTMRLSVADYAERDDITAAERMALSHVAEHVKDKVILDIGVGGGRTVKALLDISKNYTGVDYVHEMVDECKRRYPEVKFVQGDARDLSEFSNESVSLAMFSLNGISMVDHRGRLEILNEVYRVLDPGGYFLFSTYNKDNPEYNKFFRFPRFRLTKNPIRLGVRCVKYFTNLLPMIFNRYRFKKHELHMEDYSIVNDKCHRYATMLYYISQQGQINQLVAAGFDSAVLAFDLAGNKIGSGGTLDDSIFYIARKSE
jgi:ubiquinone/menaquinone biosynthesis C-methylase UbiE